MSNIKAIILPDGSSFLNSFSSISINAFRQEVPSCDFVVCLLCVVVSETCEVVLIFTKDTESIFVGQEENVSVFFDIFSDLCDTL